MKQDQDAPLPFATLIKMEICIRHNLYHQLYNLIFSYFRIKWNQFFKKKKMKKKKKKKKRNKISSESYLWLCEGKG